MEELQSLKNKILSLAIQGKLTAQSETDEPASLLLEKIKQEKERLVKEKKIKKDKFESCIYKKDSRWFEKIGDTEKDITKDIPFDIPDSWQWVRLGQLFEINPKNKLEDDLLTSFVSMGNICEGFINKFTWENKEWKSIKKSYTHFMDNDIAFAKITPCFENRKSVIFNKLTNGYGAGTTELFVLRSYYNLLNRLYVLYFLKSDYFILSGKNDFKSNSGHQRISSYFVENFIIPLPPIAEQERIVKKVEEIFKQIEVIQKSRQELDNLKLALKNKLLSLAIQGKLAKQTETDTPVAELLQKIQEEKERLVKEKKIKKDKFESHIYKKDNRWIEKIGDTEKDITNDIPFEIPESWQWVRLFDVCFLFDGIYSENEQLPYLEAKYLRGNISAVMKNQGKIVALDEYVILVDGENSGEVFKVKERGYLGSTFKILNISQACFKDYLFIFLNFYKKLLKGNKTGSAIPHLDKKLFKELLFPLPPLEEQQRITQKLEEIFIQIEKV